MHSLKNRTLPGLRSAFGRRISFAVVAVASLVANGPSAIGAMVTVGGPFALTAADGAQVTDQTYRGKWLLVYFGYTSCPDSCPATLMEIGRAVGALGAAAARLQPLFITLDPKRDTREVMEKYIQSFDPAIVALTGTPEEIATVAHEYGAYASPHKTGPGPEDYAVDHSSYLYVVDPEGKFVRGFSAETPGERIGDALRLLMEPAIEEGGSVGTEAKLK